MLCLITGADGALGATVTDHLWRAGWQLHAAVQDANADSRLRLQANGRPLSTFVADLTRPADVRNWVAAAPAPFEAVVHLVGGYRSAPTLTETDDATVDFLLDINLRTTIYVLRATLPVLRQQQSGSIVLVSARTGMIAQASDAIYGATKAAVAQLARAAAAEAKHDNVRVNAVAPGVILQPDRQDWASPEQQATFTPQDDIASAIAWLVSPASKGVSGTVLPLYGKL